MTRNALAAALVLALSASAFAQDTLVVAPDSFRASLTDWLAYRTEQGHTIEVRAPGDDVAATVRAVHTASEGALRFVVLIGDVQFVTPALRPTDAIKPFESEPEIATDAPFADIDGDDVPDLALGRIPADTPEEAQALLARSIAYERSTDFGTWRRRLNVFAGAGGFGPSEDLALELLMRLFMNRDVPPGVDLHMTYAKEDSPFCPPADELPANFTRRLSEGSLLTAYVGHGAPRNLDRMWLGDTRYPIFDTSHVKDVAVAEGSPLVVFIACSTGHLDGAADCLAEELLRAPRGPVGVIASSRVSTPYGNAVLGTEMIRLIYGAASGEAPTAGELLLAAKRRMVAEAGTDIARQQLEAMAQNFYEASTDRRAVDRREHALLYHLFGDPLLRLARPQEASCKPPSSATIGGDLAIACSSPIAGRARVEVLPRRDRDARPRPTGRTAEQRAADFAAANVAVVARAEVDVPSADSPFVVKIALPADLPSDRYLVRLYVEGADGSAQAGATIRLLPPR